MRKISIIALAFLFMACNELQQVVNQLPQGSIGNAEIASGLKEALQMGIEKQVGKLALEDGFFKNELVKILLPEELKKVDNALRKVGLGKLADEGLKVMNRSAEDAVGEAIPIFGNAIRNISFQDARQILLGGDGAATNYLQQSTETLLYDKFKPIIDPSFKKVGADKIWASLINEYNKIPFTKTVDPNLTEYVTLEALDGVYTMVEIEENAIRSKVSSRTTTLLQRVFALQD